MRTIARILAAAIALMFLVFGVRYMFFPDALMVRAGLEAVSHLGMATIRAFIGGGFLTFGILLMVHTVINQETGALRFSILFLLLSIAGRIVSLMADGSDALVVRNLVPVSLMVMVSVVSLIMFLKTEKTS